MMDMMVERVVKIMRRVNIIGDPPIFADPKNPRAPVISRRIPDIIASPSDHSNLTKICAGKTDVKQKISTHSCIKQRTTL